MPKWDRRESPNVEAVFYDGSVIYVDWNKSKVVKHGLAKGKVYATFTDLGCTSFYWWMKRSELNRRNSDQTGV